MHKLPDDELRGLIIEETGSSEDSAAVGLVFSAIKSLLKYATFGAKEPKNDEEFLPAQGTAMIPIPPVQQQPSEGIGLNLSYTINLNLPATTDIAVFNAIFKSLKENLLKGDL